MRQENMDMLNKNLDEMRTILAEYVGSDSPEKLKISQIMDKFIVTMQIVKNEMKQEYDYCMAYQRLVKGIQDQIITSMEKLPGYERKQLYGMLFNSKDTENANHIYPKRKINNNPIIFD